MITRTRINSNSQLSRTKFSFPWSKFHWNLPDDSNSPLSRNVFRFPSEFELPGFYCNWTVILLQPKTQNNSILRRTQRSIDRSIDLKMLLVEYPVRVISVAVLVATFNDAYFLAFTIEGVYFYYTVIQIFAFRFLELRLMIIYKTSPRTHHNYL